jgi:hypothetical protein
LAWSRLATGPIDSPIWNVKCNCPANGAPDSNKFCTKKECIYRSLKEVHSFLSVEEVVHRRPLRCPRCVGSRCAVRLRHGGRGRCGLLIAQVSWSRAIVLFSAAPAISRVPNPARVAQPVGACFTLTSALLTGTRQQVPTESFLASRKSLVLFWPIRVSPLLPHKFLSSIYHFFRSSTPSRSGKMERWMEREARTWRGQRGQCATGLCVATCSAGTPCRRRCAIRASSGQDARRGWWWADDVW